MSRFPELHVHNIFIAIDIFPTFQWTVLIVLLALLMNWTNLTPVYEMAWKKLLNVPGNN